MGKWRNNMKIWNKRNRDGRDPENDPGRRTQDPISVEFGCAGRRRKAGGAVATVFVVLFVGMMLAGNVSAGFIQTPQEKLNKTISNIQTFLIGIGVALAGIMIVLAGTKWITTKGQPEEQAKVKKWLFDIGMGLVLILSSSVIIEIAKGLIVT
jgi:hypothetical protein